MAFQSAQTTEMQHYLTAGKQEDVLQDQKVSQDDRCASIQRAMKQVDDLVQSLEDYPPTDGQ